MHQCQVWHYLSTSSQEGIKLTSSQEGTFLDWKAQNKHKVWLGQTTQFY